MSNVLQLSVKLLVCGYSDAFQTLPAAIRTCKDASLFVYQTRKRFQKKRSKTESLERNSQRTRPRKWQINRATSEQFYKIGLQTTYKAFYFLPDAFYTST